MQKIKPFLWFDGKAEEAASFYVSLFKNASVDSMQRQGSDGPVMGVNFTLDGSSFIAFNGGPMFKFNESISMFVSCDTQEEIDRLWNALTADGGQESMCGWLKDRFGMSWQIVPPVLSELLSDKDPAKANKVMQAMMQMKKLDIAKLKEAGK